VGSRPPRDSNWPSPMHPTHPQPPAGCLTTGPTDIEPAGLDFRIRAPNHPPSCISGSRAPSPLTQRSPAAYSPPHRLLEGSTHFPPISSPLGSIFGFVHQTTPPRASRVPEPPRLLNCPSPLIVCAQSA
jgi:hypothetical protein